MKINTLVGGAALSLISAPAYGFGQAQPVPNGALGLGSLALLKRRKRNA